MRTGGVDNGILSFSFNQDATLLALGTREGTQLYRTDQFELHRENNDDASVVALHYSTDLVAHVGAAESATSSQRAVRMVNTRLNKVITKKNFERPVLDVKINAGRVVIVLEASIHIYSLAEMKLLHTIEDIPGNVDGLCALPGLKRRTPDAMNLIAYPVERSMTHGNVHVFDVMNLTNVQVIEAHSSRVKCLSFNDSGTRLATASVKGTLVRVFATPSGDKLFELRRGIATNATIFSMAFDMSSTFLCVSSDHATVHVFKLEAEAPPTEPAPSEDATWSGAAMGLMFSAVESAATMLPTPVSDMWTQSRSFAQISLPQAGNPCLCAILGVDPDPLYVLVATSEGILYKYVLDKEVGGELERMIPYPLCSSATALLELSASQIAEAAEAERAAADSFCATGTGSTLVEAGDAAATTMSAPVATAAEASHDDAAGDTSGADAATPDNTATPTTT